MYIAFEGLNGTGKSTQVARCVPLLKELFPNQEFVITKEPGGPYRQKLKSEHLDPEEEAILFAEDRYITTRDIVVPAINRGAIPITDRCVASSIARQGGARGVGVKRVLELNHQAAMLALPSIVVYFDLGVEIPLRRSQSANPDKFDREPKELAIKTYQYYEEALELLNSEANTKIIRIEDREGIIEPNNMTRLIVNRLAVEIRKDIEGGVVRERG